MNNKEVVTAFLNHLTGKAPHLKSENGKLYSYNTVIAQWIDGILVGNITKYSNTTSRHYYYVRPHVHPIARNVPINTQDLKPYINEEEWFCINENLKNK